MGKISTIKENILLFIENQRIVKEEFYNKTEIAASNFKGKGLKSEIGGDKIVKILSVYPEINPTWLLTGKGEMLLKEDSDPKDHLPDVGDMVSLEEYKKQVKAATRLEIQLEQCQERVKALEKTVDQLKSAGSGVGRKELK